MTTPQIDIPKFEVIASAVARQFNLHIDDPSPDVAALARAMVTARASLGSNRRGFAQRLGFSSVREMHEAAAEGVAGRAAYSGASLSAARAKARKLVASDAAILVLGLYRTHPALALMAAIQTPEDSAMP